MIFMIFMKRSFHALSRRLVVGFDNGSVFCLALLFNAAGLPVLLASSFARHCSWHRNFQLSTRVFHDILQFFTSWINKANTTQFSSIVKPRFFDSPLLLFFAFRPLPIYLSKPLATKCLVWRSLAFLSVSLLDQGFFHRIQ